MNTELKKMKDAVDSTNETMQRTATSIWRERRRRRLV